MNFNHGYKIPIYILKKIKKLQVSAGNIGIMLKSRFQNTKIFVFKNPEMRHFFTLCLAFDTKK